MIDRERLHFKSVTYAGQATAPRLVVLGAVHGNETCGTRAIHRIIGEIDAGRIEVRAGTVTFIPITNPLAFERATRIGDRNLNRNLAPTDAPREFEDRVANWLCPILAAHDVLLDLHSTRAQSQPFAMLGPRDNAGPLEPFAHSAAERALALRLGARRFVEGWLETYARGVDRRGRGDARYGVGTTEYMRSRGGYAVTLECGQHADPAAADFAYRAIRNALAFLGITPDVPPAEVEDYEALRIAEVVDRAHPEDSFCREWASFDGVARGQLIAMRHDGQALEAPFDGRILFPDADALPGNEWFYLAREAGPV